MGPVELWLLVVWEEGRVGTGEEEGEIEGEEEGEVVLLLLVGAYKGSKIELKK